MESTESEEVEQANRLPSADALLRWRQGVLLLNARRPTSQPSMAEEEAGFDFVYRLPSANYLRRSQHTASQQERRNFKLAVLQTKAALVFIGRPAPKVRFRPVGIAILFTVSLSSQMKQKHVECLPLYHALDLISTATNCKVSLDSHLLNAGKCKALVLLLSLVTPHLSIFKSILMEQMSSSTAQLSRASAALSGCYYALKDLCRVIARCVDYINDSQGPCDAECNVLLPILDGASTVKLLSSEINSCLQLFLIKVGELSVFLNCGSDLWVVPLPMNYLDHYLQLQADRDLSKLLSRLKELSSPPPSIASRSSRQLIGGGDHVSNLLLQLKETPKPASFFSRINSWIREEPPSVSDLSKLLIARIQYDNMERFSARREDIASFKQGLWVENNTIKTIRFLGSGSFGTVHEVECFKGKYAMKTLRIMRIEDASEALIQARLQHPHIVKLIWYTTGYSGKQSISLLMELMHMGLDAYLVNRVQEKKCPLSKCPLLAVDLMLQIAEAMKYLHSKSIMHRDLKASNVLLNCNQGREGYLTIKLCDFGLAKQKEAMTNTANVGTNVWRAPEVLSASADEETARYSYPADVYSYAMTCYEILTSKEPYTDTPQENLRQRIRNSHLRPSLPEEDMHPDLVLLIKQCWDADPNQRPSFHAICQKIQHVKRQILFGQSSLNL